MKILLITLVNIGLNIALDSNKSKRGLDDQQNYYYGLPITLKFVQQDLSSSPTTSNTRPVIFKTVETPTPVETKPLGAHPMLYEYQQTPHNIQLNQQLQEPTHQFGTVITPAQHSTLINHNRYVSGNGKVLYYPVLPTTFPVSTTIRPFVYNSIPLNYQQARLPAAVTVPSQQFKPPPPIPFNPPQPIITKQTAPVRETVEEERREEINNEEEEEDEEEKLPYDKYEEDDDDDEEDRFEHYKHNRNHHNNKNEDDDEEDDDNTRSYSKYKQNKKFKYPYRYSYENYKKPKDYYSSNYRYYKKIDSNSKSKNKSNKSRNGIEGRYSQNVPVIHKHDVYQKEQWLITKKS